MGPLDLLAGMGNIVEKNKDMLEKLPDMLKRWGEVQELVAAEIRETNVCTKRIETLCRAIRCCVDPSGAAMDEAYIHMAPISHLDPRNQNAGSEGPWPLCADFKGAS